MKEELLLTIDVLCTGANSVEGKYQTVVMVPFTGEGKGPYFNGKILDSACDTQRYPRPLKKSI